MSEPEPASPVAPSPPHAYAVLVPVKPPARGKSRLVAADTDLRRRLASAFALDTVSACLAARRVGSVLAVTDDAAFARELAALGCATMPDGVADDLNGALRQAAAEAARRWPALVPVALCADLPALRPADLDRALGAWSGGGPGFVADAESVGTTLYVAVHEEFSPRFGPGSRQAHLDHGAAEIAGTLTTLRRDVDDLADLRDARALGLGACTAAVRVRD